MVGADDPDRAVRLQEPAGGGEPGAGEGVVGGEGGEAVPGFLDRVDPRVVGAVQLAPELEVVGRVGEDQVDALGRKLGHALEAVAGEDDVERERLVIGFGLRLGILPRS